VVLLKGKGNSRFRRLQKKTTLRTPDPSILPRQGEVAPK
jgi:hypothetical protein